MDCSTETRSTTCGASREVAHFQEMIFCFSIKSCVILFVSLIPPCPPLLNHVKPSVLDEIFEVFEGIMLRYILIWCSPNWHFPNRQRLHSVLQHRLPRILHPTYPSSRLQLRSWDNLPSKWSHEQWEYDACGIAYRESPHNIPIKTKFKSSKKPNTISCRVSIFHSHFQHVRQRRLKKAKQTQNRSRNRIGETRIEC